MPLSLSPSPCSIGTPPTDAAARPVTSSRIGRAPLVGLSGAGSVLRPAPGSFRDGAIELPVSQVAVKSRLTAIRLRGARTAILCRVSAPPARGVVQKVKLLLSLVFHALKDRHGATAQCPEFLSIRYGK